MAVVFALTIANGLSARSVVVAVFAFTTASGPSVQCARLKPGRRMLWAVLWHVQVQFRLCPLVEPSATTRVIMRAPWSPRNLTIFHLTCIPLDLQSQLAASHPPRNQKLDKPVRGHYLHVEKNWAMQRVVAMAAGFFLDNAANMINSIAELTWR